MALLCTCTLGWYGARLAARYGDTRSLSVFPAALLGFLLAVSVSDAAFWGAFFGVPVGVGVALRGIYSVRWNRPARQRALAGAAVLLMVLLCGSFLPGF